MINTVTNINHELHSSPSPDAKDKVAEGKEIVAKISAMKHEMGRNIPLPCVPPLTGNDSSNDSLIEDDGEGNVKCYNDELETFSDDMRGWSKVNWLFAECYV